MAVARCLCAALALAATPATAQMTVDLTSQDSIKAAAKLIAANLLTYYHGDEPGQIPGILPGPPPAGPYYWWLGGAMWGTLVDYWHYTGDTTYNKRTEQAITFQANSPANNFMPPNWTASLGNDDQGFWGMTAMLAAETVFPDPPPDKPQWLMLAQGVFNTQASRWDMSECGGGLRWQIPTLNQGYDYKNAIANGILFNTAARLARYTDNATYAEWADKAWHWMVNVGYIDSEFNIYDGGHGPKNCTDIDLAQFSYTAGILVQGLGFMYNYTNADPEWEARLRGTTKRTIEFFFPEGVAHERACELDDRVQCTTDMLSFKGYLHRFMAQSVQVAPIMRPIIMPVLKTSAAGAASACTPDGTCGFRWNVGKYDGLTGAGQQMNALGALTSLLVEEPATLPPVTNSTGGTSAGNAAGGGDPSVEQVDRPITTADKAGASILTMISLVGMTGSFAWMSTKFGERT